MRPGRIFFERSSYYIGIEHLPCARCGSPVEFREIPANMAQISLAWECQQCYTLNKVLFGRTDKTEPTETACSQTADGGFSSCCRLPAWHKPPYHLLHHVHAYAVKLKTFLYTGQHLPKEFLKGVQGWIYMECIKSGEPLKEILDLLQQKGYSPTEASCLNPILHIVSCTRNAFAQAGLNFDSEGFMYEDLVWW